MDKVSIDKIVPEDFPSEGLNCDMFTQVEVLPNYRIVKDNILASLVPTNIIIPNLLGGETKISGTINHKSEVQSVSMLYVPKDNRLDILAGENSIKATLGLVTFATGINQNILEEILREKDNVFSLIVEAGNRCLHGSQVQVDFPQWINNLGANLPFLSLTFKDSALPDSITRTTNKTRLYTNLSVGSFYLSKRAVEKKRSWFRR